MWRLSARNSLFYQPTVVTCLPQRFNGIILYKKKTPNAVCHITICLICIYKCIFISVCDVDVTPGRSCLRLHDLYIKKLSRSTLARALAPGSPRARGRTRAPFLSSCMAVARLPVLSRKRQCFSFAWYYWSRAITKKNL